LEASPLFNPPPVFLSLKGEGEGILEGGFDPLLPLLLLPLIREGVREISY